MREPKQDTRIRQKQIAEAALALVAEQGLRRLSISAVARRVGLVPSGIYRHYKNKDEVVAAVFDLLEQRLLALVDAAIEESDDPLEQLQGVLARHIRFIREGRAIPRMIFSEEGPSGGPERRQRILQVLLSYLGRIGQIVCQAQGQGRIRKELDVETVAMLFFGLVVPAGMRWHVSDGRFDVTRHAKRVWPMFLAAVAAEPDATTLRE